MKQSIKTVIIREFDAETEHDGFVLDLTQTVPRDCIGCWSCWWKTPGRCVHKDLDDFYQAFLGADKAVFFLRSSMGFVSGNVKTLFDRMIPHFMPYINYKTGESMHDLRYDRYPDVEVYYDGAFACDEERQLFEEYIARVFYQFSMSAVVKSYSAYEGVRA